jgi:hypothetical protein
MEASPGQRANAMLLSTIVRMEGGAPEARELTIHGGGHIAAAYSNFSTSSAGAPVPGSGTNVAGDPRLLIDNKQPFGVLSPSSPLIDRGAPELAGPGKVDIEGAPRSQDGNGDCRAQPDIGAFERPAVRCAAPRLERVKMTSRVFAPVRRARHGARSSATSRRGIKRGTRFLYRLSERARVAIVVERRCPPSGRRKRCKRYRRIGILRATSRAGLRSIRFSGRIKGLALKPGHYRARMSARDMQGLRSAEHRLAFRVIR